MESNYISKTGNFIAENKKALLYVGGALAVVIIGYAIVKRVNKGVGGFLNLNSKGSSEFKNVEIDVTKVSISDSVANTYANQLFNAMKNSGTDEDLVYAVLQKLQKKDDFRKVYNAFKERSYYVNGEPTTSAYIFGYDNLDLVEWLNLELGYLNIPTYNLAKKTVTNAGFAF